MLRVVLVCKSNDNTVNERFKYQCSIDVKNTQIDVLASMLHWYLNLSFTVLSFNIFSGAA